MQSTFNFRQTMRSGLGLTVMAVMLLAGCGRGGPSIKATPQTIHFGAAPTLNLHGSGTVSANASSGLALSFTSITPNVCTVNSVTGRVTDIAIGTCIIAADQSGNTEFAPATQATLSIAVAFDPNQIITFGAAPALTLYGTATVSATANSGLAVSYSSTTPTVCAIESGSGAVTDFTTGDCIIAADQAGDAQYLTAPQVTQTITVAPWSGPLTAPSAPSTVTATVANVPDTVTVSFIGPASSGGSPITGYSVTSNPGGITASGLTSPITLPCTTPCTGYAFSVMASNSVGSSTLSAQANVLTHYNVTATFFEPDTQPNNSIFTGSFTFDSTTGSVSNLQGTLTESMTGAPMATLPLTYQLSSVSDGLGGLLVTTFLLNTTNTLSNNATFGGTDGWTPGTGMGLFYGFPTAKNPALGGAGNAYAMIDVNLANPATALTFAQIQRLAYADCTALGMMGDTCMTGYGGIGTMGGYPVSQTITRQ